MKVLVVSNLYPPIGKGSGGGVGVAVATVQGLLALGHEPIVLTAGPWLGLKSLWPMARVEENVRVYRFFPLNLYFYANAAEHIFISRFVWNLLDTFNIHSALFARWVIGQEKINIVISHNLKGLGYLLPRVFANSVKKYIHVIHDVQLVEPSGQLFPETVLAQTNGVGVKIFSKVTRFLFSTVKCIVSPSYFLLNFYQRRIFFTHAKTAVVVNPVGANNISPTPHNGVTIITFSPSVYKGIEDLLSAWSHICDQDVILTVIDEGDRSFQVKMLAKKDNRIRWRPSPATSEDNESIWNATDILVMSSRCLENSPTSIGEAVARGVRVITTNVGGAPELVAGYGGAVVVPPAQPKILAEALLKTIAITRSRGRTNPRAGINARDYVQTLLLLTD